MSNIFKVSRRLHFPALRIANIKSIRIPIATRLILSFLLIIVTTSVIFTVVGIQLIGNRLMTEAQEKVRYDLNAGREIYLGRSNHIYDVIRLTAGRFFISEAISNGTVRDATDELIRVKVREGLDILTVTDATGKVVIRTNNIGVTGDDQKHNELVNIVLHRNVPVVGTLIVSAEDLLRESPLLSQQAYFQFIDTPMARYRDEKEETAGMMIEAAAPIFNNQNQLVAVIYGGFLLNKNHEIVDKIKETVFQDMTYKGENIGTATIFQNDVRISTNVKNADGTRAIGTRIAEEVYNKIFLEGKPWIGRAYVVNNWYITAYEPIRNINHQIIGILYVGMLEQKYQDIKRQTVLAYLIITLVGALVSMVLSYFIAQRISVPINKLVSASRELAKGNMDTKVEVGSRDEIGELADTFNTMTLALKDRDERLKEFTKNKIMESERLALIGQLAANVAHELNNPLVGIVTYSHLLLEKIPGEDASRDSLRKIVTQADRCRDIIRGLLDFSRQRKPDKTLCDMNNVLTNCISLLKDQALFQNIQIKNDFDTELPMAIIDPSQVERVFMNLMINAAEAMEGKGQLDIVTRFDQNKSFIEVDFNDTGPGIAKENLEKIFDPFFTTKATGHGVGLGLAISYGIIKEHNGTLSVVSEVGKGTTFTLRLPVTVHAKLRNR